MQPLVVAVAALVMAADALLAAADALLDAATDAALLDMAAEALEFIVTTLGTVAAVS